MDKTLLSQPESQVERKPLTRSGPAPGPSAGVSVAPIEVGLTTFIDFILKSGSPKLTVVKRAKRQNENAYDPMTDFYRVLREGIVKHHKSGAPKSALDGVMQRVQSQVKLRTYPDFLTGYRKFLGRKAYAWTQPPSARWKCGALIVRVTPELGLVLGTATMAIKMYLRSSETLDKRRAAMITHVMRTVLGPKNPGLTFGVLDVKTGKLYPEGAADPGLTTLLRGEASSFVTMYRGL